MENGIDQISIDKLKNTYIVGCDTKDFLHNLTNQLEFSENNFKLCLGGIIAEEIRAEVFKQTGIFNIFNIILVHVILSGN